jgi:short-subunit dehydrogenase
MTNNVNKGTALVTGASSGIGAIYADRLAKTGYNLILVARDADRLRKIADRLTAATKRSVEILVADLTRPSDLARVEDTLKKDSSITMLVNNAGFGGASSLLESDVNKMEQMIDLNVTALTRLTYAIAPGFVARGKGTIINISSIVAIAAEQLNGVYGASKSYVLAFTRSLYYELANKGVRVQAVLPGATETEFWNVAGMPVSNLPQGIVMSAEDMVDAALSGLEQDEVFTIPSLPDKADFDAYEKARQVLMPNLSLSVPADRYGIRKPAAV